MTIDDYAEQRNAIYMKAHAKGEEIGDKCWVELGTANRHIDRVIGGLLKLTQVEDEITACFRRVIKELKL